MRSPVPVELFAEAVINGKKVEKRVIPCEECTQAFAYTHLLPAEELSLGTQRPGKPKPKPKKK